MVLAVVEIPEHGLKLLVRLKNSKATSKTLKDLELK